MVQIIQLAFLAMRYPQSTSSYPRQPVLSGFETDNNRDGKGVGVREKVSVLCYAGVS
jgi:hypothetical protein